MSKNFKTCLNKSCGIEFNAQFSKFKDFCSKECFETSSNASVKKQSLKTPKKKCKICKLPFEPKNVSTEVVCQEYNCRVTYAMQVVEKQRIVKQKEQKRKNLEEKEKLKTAVTNWKSKLQDEINKIVRLIDKGLLCLAKNKGGQIHAGHIYARGGNQYIRYNLHNIHRQNAQSNHFQNDDGLLREGLIKEYGSEYMDFISDLRRTPRPKYKDYEYQNFTLHAKKIVLKLTKLQKQYSLKQRIELRNQINLELGIYEEEYCVFD